MAGQAAGVLRLLSLAAYLGTLTASLTNNVVVGIGRMRQFTIYTTVRGLVLGVGCVLFIRPFGLEGAGLALLLTEAVDVIYLLIVLRRYLQISSRALFRTAYFKPIALGLALAALAFLARPLANSWIGLIAVVGGLELCYIGVGYWTGVFGETEKRAVVGLWQMTGRALDLRRS